MPSIEDVPAFLSTETSWWSIKKYDRGPMVVYDYSWYEPPQIDPDWRWTLAHNIAVSASLGYVAEVAYGTGFQDGHHIAQTRMQESAHPGPGHGVGPVVTEGGLILPYR